MLTFCTEIFGVEMVVHGVFDADGAYEVEKVLHKGEELSYDEFPRSVMLHIDDRANEIAKIALQDDPSYEG